MSPAGDLGSSQPPSAGRRSGEPPPETPPGDIPADRPGLDLAASPASDDEEAPDLLQLVAAAADLCRRPLRHGVLPQGEPTGTDCCLHLECRDGDGARLPEHDLELELFRSGSGPCASLHLTLAWLEEGERPILWHGQHPVWMDGQGQRCPRPPGGEALEALARRLRALLVEATP
jgi:hypothetical protein